jgi:hypothetical protein
MTKNLVVAEVTALIPGGALVQATGEDLTEYHAVCQALVKIDQWYPTITLVGVAYTTRRNR